MQNSFGGTKAGRQYKTGFIDIYELVYKQKAIAIIHYLPQHGQTVIKKDNHSDTIDSGNVHPVIAILGFEIWY
jgi:hypothetical protein